MKSITNKTQNSNPPKSRAKILLICAIATGAAAVVSKFCLHYYYGIDKATMPPLWVKDGTHPPDQALAELLIVFVVLNLILAGCGIKEYRSIPTAERKTINLLRRVPKATWLIYFLFIFCFVNRRLYEVQLHWDSFSNVLHRFAVECSSFIYSVCFYACPVFFVVAIHLAVDGLLKRPAPTFHNPSGDEDHE